jgi:hypothetical protein
MHLGPITIRRIIMSLKICHPAYFVALVLLFALASPAFAEDGPVASGQTSTFGDVKYKALDPIQLGKEAKPLYQVDAYFKLKDLREIAARHKGLYVVPSANWDISLLGKEAKPLYQVDAYFKLKDLLEIAARDKGTYMVPSETDQEATELGKDLKPVYDVDAYFRLKDLREIGSKEKKGYVVPSKIRA